MRRTAQLLQHTARLTLFTREKCSLCDTAKSVIQDLSNKRSFDYHEVNVMNSDQKEWKALYEFDTPVVGISFPLYIRRS